MISSLTSVFTQPAVQAIASGLLAGAISGGVLLATGTIPPREPGPGLRVELLACPGSGAVLARMEAGQALLVTGRSSDGAWLEVQLAQPGLDRAWAPARVLRLEGSATTLPVAGCGIQPRASGTFAPSSLAPSAAPTLLATIVPGASPAATPSAGATATQSPIPTSTASSTPAPSSVPGTPSPLPPTSSPGPPTPSPVPPTPSPSPVVDTTAPTLSNLTTTGQYYYNNDIPGWSYNVSRPSSGCLQPHFFTISVVATDAGTGVSSVTLRYRKPSLLLEKPSIVPMQFVGSNTWQATVYVQDSWIKGIVSYFVRAQDVRGNVTADLYGSSNYVLAVDDCIL